MRVSPYRTTFEYLKNRKFLNKSGNAPRDLPCASPRRCPAAGRRLEWSPPPHTLMYDKWTETEKQHLHDYLQRAKEKTRNDWLSCSQYIGTKTPRQCYDFFNLQQKQELQKGTQRHRWTKEDQELLLMQPKLKMTWKQFQEQYFPGLTICQLKNKIKYIQVHDKKANADNTPRKPTVYAQPTITTNSTPTCSEIGQIERDTVATEIYTVETEQQMPLFFECFD